MRLRRGPLRSRNFRLLLGCDVVSVSGTAVAVVAIPFAVLATGGSAADVGYVAAAGTLPVIVFLLAGGVLADRMPRQRIMFAANVLQAMAQGAAAALVLTGTARVGELVALAAARGVGVGLYFPAAQGLLPQTVPASQLAQANAVSRVGRNSAQIAGTALGGVLTGLAGPGWGLAADAVSFAIAAALRTGMRFPASPPRRATSMLHDLAEGWRDFISRRWLWAIVVQFSFFIAIVTATTSVLGPLVAHARLGGAQSWGAIMAAYSAGAVLGGLVLLRLRPRRLLLAASLSVPAFSLLLFALAVPLAVPLIAAAGCVAGGCLEVFNVNWAVAMQQEIEPGMLSRLSSYDALGSWALAPAGAAAAGPAAAAVGGQAVLAGSGVLVIALTAAVLCVPEVRQLRRRSPADDPPGPGTTAPRPGVPGPAASPAPGEAAG
ncbi:MAG TPA: MFS transporter [Streptosporangiaceae bacterium]|jgi:MFS family permease